MSVILDHVILDHVILDHVILDHSRYNWHIIKSGMETEMEQNEIETGHARQLISEHFDFALSQLNSQCTKSSESDSLELKLT